MLGLIEHRPGRAGGHHAAAVEEGHPVGDVACEAQFVGDEQQGHAFTGQPAQHRQHLAAQFRVEGAGGFVAKEDLRFHRQGPGDGHALLLPARQLGRPVMRAVRQPHLRQQVHRLLPRLGHGHPVHMERSFHHVLESRPVREEVELLEDHPGAAAQSLTQGAVGGLGGPGLDAHVAEAQGSRIGGLEPVEASQQRALAATARAEEGHDFAGRLPVVDAVEHGHGAETFPQSDDLDHVRSLRSRTRAAAEAAWPMAR